MLFPLSLYVYTSLDLASWLTALHFHLMGLCWHKAYFHHSSSVSDDSELEDDNDVTDGSSKLNTLSLSLSVLCIGES